ncbi:MAG: pyrimidine dimer DNA glycosylase/endonuclease V [Gammaproteobacteria bacterium]|nr:pyrimidine dimer DNA glycosylase/endonuclease V [Gammaproteobacteria bacterium]MBU1624277.1 pyrimidine dimer DNA glycosylase/endonuclease V [Gammaproteobacteria bacterium]MBU1981005.1 pyrimidine dimer DNA glycosylase/endonuclease V [Gammaproteobacteria bacterium]
MRIWSLHPQHLDAKGLVALWRETLLAQKVLRGETKGYRHHPQLQRFRAHPDPLAAIADYLRAVQREAERRGYKFDASKIGPQTTRKKIAVTLGQVEYELSHLRNKLAVRDVDALSRLQQFESPTLHPLFKAVAGDVEAWEVV